jgi:cardiolipin synthase
MDRPKDGGAGVSPPPTEKVAAEVEVPVRVPVAGHELTLFVESHTLIAAMAEDIRTARDRVWLESYIFLDDAAGRLIADAIMERARSGADVRVLYDAIGSQATSTEFFDDLERSGVNVHAFHSLREALWKFRPLRILNRRNHRKLLVVDDRVAYFGGMNITDVSSFRTVEKAEHLPAAAGWRDVHVRLTGPQQREVAVSFDRSWRRAHGEPVSWKPRAYRKALLANAPESIQFFDSGPGPGNSRAARLFARLIAAARRRLTLSMAYFLPVGGVLRELLKAPRRGVVVRVIVPEESDVPLVQHATRHLYYWLLRRRFRICERRVNMLHSKVMVVDDSWTVVGSCNLDARSLYINLEFLAVFHSQALARAVNRLIRYEIAHSKRVTMQEYREHSWWRRLVNRLAWALRWWL